MLWLGPVWQCVSFELQTAIAPKKAQRKVQGGEEEEGLSARHKSKSLKVEPRKLCLRLDIHQKVLSPTNVIWFGIKAWKWWRRPKIGDVKDDCTVLHFSISSFRATKWGWYSDWMSFTVTAVLFPHKGGPSNGLRSVRNRRGGTKQGFLLRVHSHISDGENHCGSQVSFTLVHTLFCHPNPGLWKGCYCLKYGPEDAKALDLGSPPPRSLL